MDVTTSLSPDDYQANDWFQRCRYWQAELVKAQPKRKRREKQQSPIVLTGQGMVVRIDKGSLLVRDGHTHFPSSAMEKRYFKGDLDLPDRLIMLDGSGSITLDALDWLMDQGVQIIRLKWDGTISTLSSPSGYAAEFEKVKWQIETRGDEKARIEFAAGLIRGKLEASIETLENYVPAGRKRSLAIATAIEVLSAIEQKLPDELSELLGMEGKAGAAYFRAWSDITIQWKAESRYPVPADWKVYKSRSAVRSKFQNNRATHPINAMLNYAYKVFETQLRIEALTEGYDPTIGIVHGKVKRGQKETFFYALDLMEPWRPVVDRVILEAMQEHKFCGADFTLQSDGVCRLNPEMAKWLIGRVLSKFH